MKSIEGMSLERIRTGDSHTLATITKEKTRGEAHRHVAQFVLQVAVQMNLQNKMNDQAVMAIAEDVYDTGYFLKTQELAYFFKQLRKGAYGPMYENFNSERVCRALVQYIQDAQQFHSSQTREEHKQAFSHLYGKEGEREDPWSKFRAEHRKHINKPKS